MKNILKEKKISKQLYVSIVALQWFCLRLEPKTLLLKQNRGMLTSLSTTPTTTAVNARIYP